MPKRKLLMQEVGELLNYDFSKVVSTASGLFVCSIEIEEIRILALVGSPLLSKEAHFKKVARLFDWMHADKIHSEQDYEHPANCIRLRS